VGKTAIAAPPADAFDELFAFIDKMPMRDLPALATRLRRRHGIRVTTGMLVRDMAAIRRRLEFVPNDWSFR
jgi:hypothetical protein